MQSLFGLGSSFQENFPLKFFFYFYEMEHKKMSYCSSILKISLVDRFPLLQKLLASQTHPATTGTRSCLGIWLRSFSTQVRPIVPLLRYHYEKKLSLGFILCDLFPKVHHHLYLRGSEACLVGSEACLAGSEA